MTVDVRQIVLDTIKEQSKNGEDVFRADEMMKEISKKVNDGTRRADILTHWNDLLRAGFIALWNLDDTVNRRFQGAGVYFVTKSGEKSLEHVSRDPINQNGYMAYLDQDVTLDPVTRGYVEEALGTYRACCYKATAVMIGAAVENLALNLRDELVARLKAHGGTVTKKMESWKVKTFLEAVAEKIISDLRIDEKRTKDDAKRQLLEDAEARLFPVAVEFRKTRNDAGHPASLDPVHPADVHSNLLLFPTTAKLFSKLTEWVVAYYV
jgi:hypothetical protein